jgi:hypothetical protein
MTKRPRVLYLEGPHGVATVHDYSNAEVVYHVGWFWRTGSDRRGASDASHGQSELHAVIRWALHSVGIGHVWVEHDPYDWSSPYCLRCGLLPYEHDPKLAKDWRRVPCDQYQAPRRVEEMSQTGSVPASVSPAEVGGGGGSKSLGRPSLTTAGQPR